MRTEVKTIIKEESDFAKFSYAYADDTGYCTKLAAYEKTKYGTSKV